MNRRALPHGITHLLDRTEYTRSDYGVDVTKTWRRHGWVPGKPQPCVEKENKVVALKVFP